MVIIDNILDVEKHIDEVDAVIFDLDDTLYSEKDYVRSGYRAVAEAFPGVPAMYDELWAAFERKEPALDVVFKKHAMSDRKDEALHIYRFHKPVISLYPGVREMLDRIAEMRKIGIITDGRPEGQRAKLEALGLTDIPFIITDELGGIQFRKPCETAYREMAKKLDAELSRMVYVGDNPKKDFQACEQLGMRWMHFRNENSLYV